MKRQLSHLYRSVLLGLCLPLANYLVSLPTHDLPWGPPLGAYTHSPQPRWILKWRLLGGTRLIHYGLALPWLLTHKGPFCARVVSPLSQKGESRDPLILQTEFCPLYPCHDFYLDHCHDSYLRVFTRDKDWLLTLFLLLLPFLRANGRLIVNSSAGPHVSLVSGNVNRCKDPAWSPLLPAPWNANRRPAVKVWPGVHLSPASAVLYLTWSPSISCLTSIVLVQSLLITS